MRFIYTLRFTIVMLLVLMAWLLSFNFSDKYAADFPVEEINQSYLNRLEALVGKVKQLESQVNKLESKEDLETLRTQFLNLRLDYKRIEYLAAYSDPDYNTRYINGAPLLKIDDLTFSGLVIKEPDGLQVIDELLFSDEAIAEKAKLRKKVSDLHVHLKTYHIIQKQIPLTNREVFEAIRQELVRVFTLGLTGFDTPGSINALPDAQAAWSGLQETFAYYKAPLDEPAPGLYQEIDSLFEAGNLYFEKDTEFETFDRLAFFTQYLNPIFAKLLDAHLALEIETIVEVEPLKQSTNYHAKNIFSDQYINAKFFITGEAAEDNPERRALGRMLFFDPALSSNNERACASCHKPELAFTDGKKKSLAFNFEGTINRNSPTLINSIFADRFFYDLRAEGLNFQTEHVIIDKKEFNTDFFEIIQKLQTSDEYNELFSTAFPRFEENPINKHTITTALASYVGNIYSFDSPFDQYVKGEVDTIPAAVRRGFNIFMGKGACGTCHFAPVFNGSVPPLYTDSESEILGVPATTDTINPELDPDMGRYDSGRFKEKAWIHKRSFKTPTVRNIALTAPYMHNGVYETLEEVMDFYNKGGGTGLGLDVLNQTLPPDPLGLNTDEIHDVISFMEALTDTTGLTAMPSRLPQFPDPQLNQRVIGGKY